MLRRKLAVVINNFILRIALTIRQQLAEKLKPILRHARACISQSQVVFSPGFRVRFKRFDPCA
jgi:hypothetical protein